MGVCGKMKITSIRADSISPKSKGICGEFTITLDELLCIHRVYVINGKKGLFIAFPNVEEIKFHNDKKRYIDLVHPTNQEFRKYIESLVIEKYISLVEKN